MRPKARDWPNTAARLNWVTGWRRVTQQGAILTCTWWTVHAARVLTDHTTCPGLGLIYRIRLLNVHKTAPWATSRKECMTWYSSIPMPCLWGSLCRWNSWGGEGHKNKTTAKEEKAYSSTLFHIWTAASIFKFVHPNCHILLYIAIFLVLTETWILFCRAQLDIWRGICVRRSTLVHTKIFVKTYNTNHV